MATTYASAVRNGSMEAARFHVELGMKEKMEKRGGSIDVFAACLAINLPLILRPLKGLLGVYLPKPIPGVLVTTERPLSIQRYTAAHEVGHFRLKHQPSLDDENIIRRMAMPHEMSMAGPNMQETEADAFAATFLMPRWLIEWHCIRQQWLASDLASPLNVYQLSLRLGTSYEATIWTLQRSNLISPSVGQLLREVQPRKIKAELLKEYRPTDYRGDVWLLTERDCDTQINGSHNDHFILLLNEHSGGYLWNIEELKASGFAIIRDGSDAIDDQSIGAPTIRNVTAAPEQAQKGEIALHETRPWQPENPIAELKLGYDFTGPEEEGLSHAERRKILEAA